MAVSSGEPERDAEFAELADVDGIARAVDRFSDLRELHPAARRRVVPAGSPCLDDEAVHTAVGLLEHGGGEGVGGYNGQELRPGERWKLALDIVARVKAHGGVVGFVRAGDVEGVLRALVVNEAVEHAGDLERDARAHDDVFDTRQHRAVDAWQMGGLDLLKEVNANWVLMALARKVNLDEVGHNAELNEFARVVFVRGRDMAVWGPFVPAAGDEVTLPDALGHGAVGEGVETAAHMTAVIAVLQPAGEDLIERSSGESPS